MWRAYQKFLSFFSSILWLKEIYEFILLLDIIFVNCWLIIPESSKPDYVVEFLQGRHLYFCQKIRITYAKLYDIKRFIYFNFFLGIINVLSTQIQSGPPPASHRATINVNLIQNIEDSYETAITCLLQLYNSTIKKKHRKSLPVIFLVLKILLNWIYLLQLI